MSDLIKPKYSDRQKEAVRSLPSDPNFKQYLGLVDGRITLRTEELVRATDGLKYRQGFVQGLMEARNLVDSILKELDSKDVRDSRERDAGKRRSEQRRLASFGTQWFQRL